MSVHEAQPSVKESSEGMAVLKHRLEELEGEILEKSETLARLERAKQNPVSLTASLVEHSRPKLSLGNIKLKPTQTKVSNDHALPSVEQESLEASEIKPWLYLAGNIIARDANRIKQIGVSKVLNVAHTVCPNYHEKDFSYTSFDLIDHPSETIDHFILAAIAEIERCRQENSKILVHCHQGISRSATLVVAYVAWLDNISIDEALQFVKSKRKIISPNSGFLNQLKRFEARLRRPQVGPSLHHVAPHSDEVKTLVVKEIFDRNRPLIDDDDVFLLYEGPGGDILIREPKIHTDDRLMATAKQVAEWMTKYERAYAQTKVVVVPYDSERFLKALEKIPVASAQPSSSS